MDYINDIFPAESSKIIDSLRRTQVACSDVKTFRYPGRHEQ